MQRSASRLFCLSALVISCLATVTVSSVVAGDRLQDKRLSSKTRSAVTKFGDAWWKARPKTRFEQWDPAARASLLAEASQIEITDGELASAVEALWKNVKKLGPRARERKGKAIIDTPYGEAWFYVTGAGKDKGLLIGLHGGGEGAGSADSPRGTWRVKDCMGMYPQGIRLVHDTWNTVHGEKFILTMIDIAKTQYQIDPQRVYSAGFSMGGTGSWFMSGRHPDLFAATLPFAGVLMAEPKSQLQNKEDVVRVQHGLVPNVRNLAMYYTIGLQDRNTMPGTYLHVWDRIEELREKDPGGYRNIHFESIPGLAHSFPPGEPAKALRFAAEQTRDAFPRKIVWEHASKPFPLAIESDKTDRHVKREFYWIGCDDPVDRQIIRAERDGNTIDIETEGRDGVKGVTVFLNPEMIDVAEDVVITHSGKEVYRGKPQPDFATIVDTLDRRLDRVLVFDRRIDL